MMNDGEALAGAFLGFLVSMAIMCFCVGPCVVSSADRRWEHQAVSRGAATYELDKDGNASFQWKSEAKD